MTRDGPATFDWPAAYRRLERVRAALEGAEQPTSAQIRQRLRQRAAALAQPLAGGRERQLVDLVGFRLGGTRYAIPAHQAAAVIAVAQPTSLPGLPQIYLGVVGHRGSIYALADIRPIIGVAAAAPLQPSHAVLLASGRHALAVAVEAVDGFMRLDSASIARTETDAREHAVIQGIGPGSVVILDAKRLLADARLVVNREPLARGQERQGDRI